MLRRRKKKENKEKVELEVYEVKILRKEMKRTTKNEDLIWYVGVSLSCNSMNIWLQRLGARMNWWQPFEGEEVCCLGKSKTTTLAAYHVKRVKYEELKF